MDWETFEDLVRYILNNLYDFAALETNEQIFTLIKPPAGIANRGDYVRQVIVEAISQLRPARKEEASNSLEWRPYLILQKRYVEGMGLNELAIYLSISNRQLRRDHHRALEAMTILLGNRFLPDQPPLSSQAENSDAEQMAFEVHQEALDLEKIINGVLVTLKKKFEDEQISTRIQLPNTALHVTADRVVLRQVLIGMFNEISRMDLIDHIDVNLQYTPHEAAIQLQARYNQPDCNPGYEGAGSLDTLRSWCALMNARLEDDVHHEPDHCLVRRTLWLKRLHQKLILVVDDQEPAINMFRRYLSHTDWKVVGANQADQIVELARQHQPDVITLDIMMPQVDGWELLQKLKMNEDTDRIPVIVCSAWVDADLARSLGASGYLKKPVTQEMFMEALEGLGLA